MITSKGVHSYRSPARVPAGQRIGLLTRHLVPASYIGRRLAAVALVDAFGSGLYYTGAALYFTRIVGFTASQVGIGLTLGALGGVLASVPIGRLADSLGVGRVYVALQLLRGVGYAVYALQPSFPLFLAVALLIGITDAAIPAVHQAVIGVTVSGEGRVDTLAKIRAVRNVSFGLGALLAAVAISAESRTAYVALIAANAVSFFATAALLVKIKMLQVSLPTSTGSRAVGGTAAAEHHSRIRVRFLLSGGLNGILATHGVLLVVALPLWFTTHTSAPPAMVGVLIAINTALAVLLQAPLARASSTLRGALRSAALAGTALAGFAAFSAAAGHLRSPVLATAAAVGAVTALTLAEVWQSAAGWSISYATADGAHQTESLSTFQLGTSVQAIAAPILITTVVLSSPWGWLLLGAVCAAAGLALACLWRHRLRPRRAVPAAGADAARRVLVT